MERAKMERARWINQLKKMAEWKKQLDYQEIRTYDPNKQGRGLAALKKQIDLWKEQIDIQGECEYKLEEILSWKKQAETGTGMIRTCHGFRPNGARPFSVPIRDALFLPSGVAWE